MTNHKLNFDGKTLGIEGVSKVVEISDKECLFKLADKTLAVKGSGLNVVRLDRTEGVVVLETEQFERIVWMKLLGVGKEQLYVFLLFVALGVVVGVGYLIGYKLTKGRLAAALFDGIYCTASAFALFFLNLTANNGQARLHVFVGLAVGVALSCAICSKPLDKPLGRLYNRLTQLGSEVNDDGTTVSQKIDGNTDGSGNTGIGAVALRTVDNPVTNDGVARSRRKTAKTGGKRKKQ